LTGHLSPIQVEDYHRNRLSSEVLLEVDDHLADCGDCRQLMESSTLNTLVLYDDFATEAALGSHLTFEQSAAFVDGLVTGDERRSLEDHLAVCAQCGPLISDLRIFRNQVASDLDREVRPSDSRPEHLLHSNNGFRSKFPFFKFPVWIYASVAAVVLVGIAAWVVWRFTSTSSRREAIVVSPTVTPSPSIDLVSPTPPDRDAGTVLVRLNEGGSLLTINSQGELVGAEAWPQEYQRMAREALMNQRVEKSSQLAGLNRRGSSLMGGDDKGQTFGVIEPAGKIIFIDRPVFRWSTLTGATGYIVEVYDGNFNSVATSPVVTGNSWTAPSLKRGQLYSWQVKATKDGQEFLAPRPPAAQAQFRVLDQASSAEISRVRRDYSSSHLLLGLLYAKAGLLEEAERELSALQAVNPDASVLRRLSESIRASRN